MVRWSSVVPILLVSVALAAPPDDPSKDGPLTPVKKSLDYMSADGTSETLDIELPKEPSATPKPVVLIVHGWANNGPQYDWLAKHLATRGFVAATFTAPYPIEFDVTSWVPNVRKAIDALESANGTGGLLEGQLDMNRFALVGHSYGGATSIGVAAVDTRVKTVVGFAPGTAIGSRDDFLDSAKKLKTPLLVISSEIEYVVPTEMYGHEAFRLAPSSPKTWIQIKGAEHVNYADVGFDWWAFGFDDDGDPVGSITGGKQRTIASRYATQWVERFLNVTPDPDGSATHALVAQGLADKTLLHAEEPSAPPPPQQRAPQQQGPQQKRGQQKAPSQTRGIQGALGQD